MPKVYENSHKNVLMILLNLVVNIKIWTHFLKIKWIKNESYQNILKTKIYLPFLYSQMIFFCKDLADFWRRKWLWKSEFCHIWPFIQNLTKDLEPFDGRFHRPLVLFTHLYSQLCSAMLSCSSEVTLFFVWYILHLLLP